MSLYEYTAKQDNERVDAFVSAQNNTLSRSAVQKLIAGENILVNGKKIKANYRLKSNDCITVIVPEPVPLDIKAEKIPLDILYEDEHIIVINKQRGMIVHPAPGVYSGTLVNALLAHCHDLSGINGIIRPGIVHRLDKDTSGVMVAAKTDEAHLSLAEQIGSKKAQRCYLAIANGNISENEGRINGNIGRHPVDRKKMAVLVGKGKSAATIFEVLERFRQYTFIKCRLLTGRTHQIRVHMAYIGHPLLGDPCYSKCNKPLDRKIAGQALHSNTLKLYHPATGQEMLFTAPVPDDMVKILAALKNRNGSENNGGFC
ncbi:RluA family pseudouridine synthase [Pectinatus haikarae]|uniref:Pseudouridine synthase n=1 Tax=Pectinatus haikarae TaxID=349096 RepID=A0ABT9Y665_9FIRM|nr:RluA family pseudouridine synthase [Pectinatus haikarae]MDQ0203010.1 23S rRNA pseudouridine1911/1915/1917 synthase [Pectinatus haikarae]